MQNNYFSILTFDSKVLIVNLQDVFINGKFPLESFNLKST